MSILLHSDAQGNSLHSEDPSVTNPWTTYWANMPIGQGQLPWQAAVDQVVGWLRLFAATDQIIELRALKVSSGSWSKRTYSGFFDTEHLPEMAAEALHLTKNAEGVYFTLNPLNRALLSRRCNRVDVATHGDAASDNDVQSRRWLLIDADPVRSSGISSTEDEKASARQVIISVREHLGTRAWPEPILADSGNGYHLLYRIDLPSKDNELVRKVLGALAQRFDTEAVKIDPHVFNPGRIVKLYGTQARKGDAMAERPHRWTKVLDAPAEPVVVPTQKLEEIASEAPTVPRRADNGFRKPAGYCFDRQEIRQRANAYLHKLPPAISGQSGHDKTFHAACVLIQGFDLSIEEALPLFETWNETCQPPWPHKDLLHKLEDADKRSDPRGYLLRDRNGESDRRSMGSAVNVCNDVPADGSRPLKHDDDPNRLAEHFLQRYSDPDGQKLRFWRGDWQRWDECRYLPMGSDELRGELWRSIEGEFNRLNQLQLAEQAAQKTTGAPVSKAIPRAQKVSNDLVNNVRGALASLSIVDGNVNQPTWLDDGRPFPAEEMLAAKNGLIHLPSVMAGTGSIARATPAYFSSMALDYAIDLNAPAPTHWLNFLNGLWPDDPESIPTLQEWFGYCLLPDTSLQKLLFLLGPTRSGKGTMGRVLRALIGEDNAAGPTLSSLATNFGLSPLLGKPLAIISDARLSGRADQAEVVERLLAITGEDALTIDRKNRTPVTVKLPTRILLISNELPRLTDASGALVSRMVVLQLKTSWLGREDTALLSRLLPERPGILLWAIEGLKRLRQRGRFIQPASSKASFDQLDELSSPIKAFVNQCCNLDATKYIAKYAIFNGWKTWCNDRGYKHGNEATFGKNLLAAFPEITGSSRSSQIHRPWQYKGIELRPDAPLEMSCQR